MNDIDTYLAALPQPQKEALERIRNIVLATVPDCEQVISYGLPTIKYKGKALIHFGAFKDHLSLFPTAGPVAAFKEQLQDYSTAKGTIQFTVDKPIPEATIKDILAYRVHDIDGKRKS